jgi:hypothetical protein
MRVKDARQTFLGIWIRLLIEDRPFEVWGGDQLREFFLPDQAVDGDVEGKPMSAAIGRHRSYFFESELPGRISGIEARRADIDTIGAGFDRGTKMFNRSNWCQ